MTGRLQLNRRPGGVVCGAVVIERGIEIVADGRLVAEPWVICSRRD